MGKQVCLWAFGRLGMSCLIAVVMTGCGDGSGADTFDISGAVSFGGTPVPEGRIVFEPDTAQGNSGPQGYAVISQGSFNTRDSGRGHVGGPHRVTIDGYDGVVVDEDYFPQGSPLFPSYSTDVELPTASETRDFDVPAVSD